MKIKYLENIDNVKNAFLNRFVLSWADYQIKRRQWFEGMTEEPNPIAQEWYIYQLTSFHFNVYPSPTICLIL